MDPDWLGPSDITINDPEDELPSCSETEAHWAMADAS